jgi:4-azaleucine resistance transporter AzlC
VSTRSPNSTPRSEFWAGVRATIPLLIGAAPFGLIFGALAINSGLSLAGAGGFSAIVFAGSAQFIAAGLVASGVGTGFIILTTLIVNLRHALYGATLAPHTAHLPQRWLLPLAFWLTDETFAVVASHYAKADSSPHKHWYFFGSAIFMYVNWQAWTWLGIFVGQSIPNPAAWGLDFAMVVTFIGLLVPFVRNHKMLVAVLVAGLVALLANGLPNKLGLMAASLAGVAVGMGLDWLEQKESRRLPAAQRRQNSETMEGGL